MIVGDAFARPLVDAFDRLDPPADVTPLTVVLSGGAVLSPSVKAGWVDTFRHFEKASGHYTWWSQRVGVRDKNIGWRIDYMLASPAAMRFVRGAAIHPEVRGSDHCPVSVDVDPAIFGASRR